MCKQFIQLQHTFLVGHQSCTQLLTVRHSVPQGEERCNNVNGIIYLMAHCDEIWQSLRLGVDPPNHSFHACLQELQGTLQRGYELLI